MTITEANAVTTLLRFAAGEDQEPDRVRASAEYLAERASKPLLLTVQYDQHGLDAEIARRSASR